MLLAEITKPPTLHNLLHHDEAQEKDVSTNQSSRLEMPDRPQDLHQDEIVKI